MSAPPADLPTPKALAELWNEHKSPLQPSVNLKHMKPGSPRWRSAKARLVENPDLEHWTEVVRRIARSSFCRGEIQPRDGSKPWVANFDWLVKPATHVKVLEGQYDDRDAKTSQSDDAYWAEFHRLVAEREAREGQ